MKKFINKLNNALSEATRRLISIPKSIHCAICQTNHIYYMVEADKREVARVSRVCNSNIRQLLGWKVEYTSDVYSGMESSHDMLDAGQSAEQGAAPFRTANEAIASISAALGIPVAPSQAERRDNAMRHVRPASQLHNPDDL